METAGEPPFSWQVWQAMFRDHMVAYGQNELQENRQVAILKSSLGAEGYKMCMTLCPEDNLTLDVVLERLSNRFAPKVSKIYARSVFHRRSQLQGETCLQFVSVLRALMVKCGYDEEFKLELLRDRFVAGCSSDKIREKLMLENDDMTLEQALVISNNCERVAIESKSVVSASQVDDSTVLAVHVKRRGRSVSKGACFACGKQGHHKGDSNCPAVGRKCKLCKGNNHFAVCCKRKNECSTQRVSGGKSQSLSSNVKVGAIDTCVDALNRQYGKSISVECIVNTEHLCLICDTGARVSILNEHTVKKLNLIVTKPDKVMLLKTYTGAAVSTLGVVKATVRCGDNVVQNFSFVVVKSGSNIMGLDLFEALGYSIDIPSCHSSESCKCNRVEVTVVEHRFKAMFRDLFGQPETIVGYVHKPKLDPAVVPRMQALRRVPIALQSDVSTELNRMVDEGILEPIDASEWVSNMVVVRKPTGGVRICCDLTDVNKAVVADKYPLPTIEELSNVMARAKYFSKIDLKGGYLQVPLETEFRCITAMITPIGLFQWARLPPGLSSAPSCFQKIVSLILKGCVGVVNLLDDILVCGRTRQEHDDRLFNVLCRLRDAHVRLNGDKTVFGVPELDFVGFHVSEHGVTPLRSNVEAVQAIEEPLNVRQLRAFLGSVGFYMKFIRSLRSLQNRCMLCYVRILHGIGLLNVRMRLANLKRH